jgi:tetrahydromethanopterin S-methyltransferase subunit G
MQIYINKKEIEAIRNAWEQVNARLESCSDDQNIDDMQEILKRLSTIDDKYKNSK